MHVLIKKKKNQKVASKVLDYQQIYNKKDEKPKERRGPNEDLLSNIQIYN